MSNNDVAVYTWAKSSGFRFLPGLSQFLLLLALPDVNESRDLYCGHNRCTEAPLTCSSNLVSPWDSQSEVLTSACFSGWIARAQLMISKSYFKLSIIQNYSSSNKYCIGPEQRRATLMNIYIFCSALPCISSATAQLCSQEASSHPRRLWVLFFLSLTSVLKHWVAPLVLLNLTKN